jgi:hypothetical protein
MQMLELNDPWDCESFPLKTGFLYVQVPFKIGLTVKMIFSKYVAFIEMVYGKYWYLDSLFKTFSCHLKI